MNVITEYAVWWDTDSPNDPDADIRGRGTYGGDGSYDAAKAFYDLKKQENPDDPPRGICRRNVVTVEDDWELEEN